MTNTMGLGQTLYRAEDLRGKSRRRREALARAAAHDGAPPAAA